MLKAARKVNGAERKRSDEQEQKQPPELEKIVDMPLITSANMISVVRKESPAAGGAADPAEKAAEMTQRCAQPDKRNAALPSNGAPAVKKTEAEASRILPVAQSSAPSAGVGERTDDDVKRSAKKSSEKREGEEGLEVAATPSKNDESVSTSVAGKDAGKADSRGRDERRFCFESSRELAGEPDGRADEEEVTEPPALPTSPPPMIIATEPRPSFLHGGLANDSKAKPAVPQKPLTFSAKAADAPLTVRKIPNGDYVLPPPSVQNVASRPVQNFSEYHVHGDGA